LLEAELSELSFISLDNKLLTLPFLGWMMLYIPELTQHSADHSSGAMCDKLDLNKNAMSRSYATEYKHLPSLNSDIRA